MIAVFAVVPGMAMAQAPAGSPAQPQAKPEAPPAAQPQQQPLCTPGTSCPVTPEQMKQMPGKTGHPCCMQAGQACPMHQQMQKQMDELNKRVEALEKKMKGRKK